MREGNRIAYRQYRFGPFHLDANEWRLYRDGKPVPLPRKVFDLLRLLVADAGRLKTREELIEALWQKTVVEEQGLSTRIHALRRALGDEGETPAYIETVRGIGYRFIAPVTVEPNEISAMAGPASAGMDLAPDAAVLKSQRKLRIGLGVTALIVVLVVVGLFAWRLTRHPPLVTTAQAATASIAVLPFENLNVGNQDAYFVAGIQDLILTKLADIGDLKVIARTSTQQYTSHPDNLATIAQQLGVATILEGSVQKSGNQVLINVQLIDARTASHIWAHSYQRTLENIFGVEGEVADKIATSLRAKLSTTEIQRLAITLSPDEVANDLFLRAEYFANRNDINVNEAGFKEAIPLYQRALAQYPGFALAHARLSYVESALAFFWGGDEINLLKADARAQAERALALQPDLAEAHLALGYSDYWGRSDYAAALMAFAATLKLRPNDADALVAMGYVLRRQGHFDAAIDALQKALTLDPHNSRRIFRWLGSTYMLVSRYTEAEQMYQRALALDPNNIDVKIFNSNAILYSNGDVTRALAEVQGNNPQLQLQQVSLLFYQRNFSAAKTLLERIPDTADNFGQDGSKKLLLANLYWHSDDFVHARSLYAQALPQIRAGLAAQASNAIELSGVWGDIANAEAGLGHTHAALSALDKSQVLITRSGDPFRGSAQIVVNAAVYAQIGRADLSVPLLEKVLATPGIGEDYSPVMLWLDPSWDPIRKDAHFQALLKEYSNVTPAPEMRNGG
ncbi:MAG: winged helix-turn-helix domain-containing protein [Gammaproteobacteria bacterium]